MSLCFNATERSKRKCVSVAGKCNILLKYNINEIIYTLISHLIILKAMFLHGLQMNQSDNKYDI